MVRCRGPVEPVGAVLAAIGAMPRTLCLIALVAACSSATPPPTQNSALDFALMDVNPNSVSTGLMVSPRDFLGGVSAWYFGSAT